MVAALGEVGLNPRPHRYPRFSGGQPRTRSRAHPEAQADPARRADSALDMVQAQIVEFAATCRSRITTLHRHDLRVIRADDRVIVMRGGKVVETGCARQVFSAAPGLHRGAAGRAHPDSARGSDPA
jgi:ABC-type microcin C transport system duplicated ATPase subunit YejF